jgi:hypothetical protein
MAVDEPAAIPLAGLLLSARLRIAALHGHPGDCLPVPESRAAQLIGRGGRFQVLPAWFVFEV